MARRLFDPGERLADRHLDDLTNMQPGNANRQGLFAQSIATTSATRAIVLIALELFTNPIGIRFPITPLHVGNDAFKDTGHLIDTPAFVIAERDFFIAGAIEEHLLHMLGKVFPWSILVELVMSCNRLDGLQEIGRLTFAPRRERPVIEAQGRVRNDKSFIEEQLFAKTITIRTCAKGGIEGKQSRFYFRDSETAYRTGEIFGEGQPLWLPFFWSRLENCDPIRKIKRSSKTIREPCLEALSDHDPIHDHINIVAVFLVECRRFIQFIKRTINLDPLKPLLAQFEEFLAILALSVPDDRGKQIAARPLFKRHDPINHVLNLLCFDGQAGGRAIRRADPGEEKPQVIVDFGHRAHRRTRVLRGRLLLDRNRRRQTTDVIHIGLFHHIEELTRIGRK